MKSSRNQTDRLQTHTVRMVLVVILFLLVISFLTIIITTQDPAWFTRDFTDQPEKVVVYQDGKANEYRPGQTGFEELAEGVRASLASGVTRPSGIGLSPGSLEDAYNLYVSVEAFFKQPVKLHAWFNTDSPTRMLFPITGRHSQQPLVFLGVTNAYLAGAPVLSTKQPLLDVLSELGYKIN
jgi:hypothetical protein